MTGRGRRYFALLLGGAIACESTHAEVDAGSVNARVQEDDTANSIRVADAWVASQPGTSSLRARAIGTCTRERASDSCPVRDLLEGGTWVVYEAAGRLRFPFLVEVDWSDGGLSARFRRPRSFPAGFKWIACGCRSIRGFDVHDEGEPLPAVRDGGS